MNDGKAFTLFSEIIGQDRAIGFLKGVISKGKVPHAYLFTGPSGVGKTTTAMALAQTLNCQNPSAGQGCSQCLTCRQIANGSFPDLTLLEPQGQNIKIQQIRELNRALSFKRVSGRYRICVLRGADTMTDEAANSFLKTLEEPFPGNIFVLNVMEPLNLLPTILSRCQRISFRPIPVDAIERWLREKKGLDQETSGLLARVSQGSLGMAVRMSEGDYLEKRRDYLFKLLQIPNISYEKLLEMALECAEEQKTRSADEFSIKERGMMDPLSVWKTWYRDLIVIKMDGLKDLLINFDFSHKLQDMRKNYSIKNLIESFMILDRAQRDLQRARNLDLIMENTLMSLKRLSNQKSLEDE
ncbi:MAG: DNA polymerase III subunit delta' [Pseudomonadota bacterium]